MVDDLKAYAGRYTDARFNSCPKYGYCRPFTKESLLYRELFEQVYPGQAHMIGISGCPTAPGRAATSDPSARVLSITEPAACKRLIFGSITYCVPAIL